MIARAYHPLRCLLIGVLLVVPAVGSSNTECHIHPPGSTPDNPVNTLGPYDSVQQCEQDRMQRFGAAGYCHCSADFTPDWRRLEPGPQNIPGAPAL